MFNYEDLLGVKFKCKGNSPEEGFDCWTLCQEVYRRIGLKLPDFDYLLNDIINEKGFNYEGTAKKMTQFSSYFEKISHPEPYCLVSFFIRPPYTTHVGVVLADCIRFIHILKNTSVVIERLDSVEWKKRITGFWRYKGATR